MLVLLNYSVLTMGGKQQRKCQLYPFSKKITCILIFSNAIGNSFAASDRHFKNVQLCLYGYFPMTNNYAVKGRQMVSTLQNFYLEIRFYKITPNI